MFDFKTVTNFDDHIQRSIPGYSMLVRLITRMAPSLRFDTWIDIGCTTGTLVSKLGEYLPEKQFIGVDVINDHFPKPTENVSFIQGYASGVIRTTSGSKFLISSLFTLQFMEERERKMTLDAIYQKLEPGGYAIIAEKVYPSNPRIADILGQSLINSKLNNGFSHEEVLTKSRDLLHIMRPYTEDENLIMFTKAGFERENITTFWQSLQFKAWLLIK